MEGAGVHREKTAVYKPRREASVETNCLDTLYIYLAALCLSWVTRDLALRYTDSLVAQPQLLPGTRGSWSPLSGLKGVKPPVEFGERTRDCSPGHAGAGSTHSSTRGLRPPEQLERRAPLRQTQRSPEWPRHLHRIPRLSEAPREVP